jgi:hypothetical protein
MLGFLDETDRELREFVENIDIHYTNNRRDAMLKLGRALIMSEDFKTIQVKDLDKDGKSSEESDNSIGSYGLSVVLITSVLTSLLLLSNIRCA